MNFQYKLLISEFIFLAIGVIVIFYMKLFTFYHFLGALMYIVLWIFFYSYASFKEYEIKRINQYETTEKESFEYTWTRTNTILRSRPGSDGINWDSGKGIKVSTKTYKDYSNNEIKFRAFLAHTVGTKNSILIIYNCKSEDIDHFEDDPGTEDILDPWKNFNPFGSNNNYNNEFMQYNQNPYKRDRRFKTNNNQQQRQLRPEPDFNSLANSARGALND